MLKIMRKLPTYLAAVFLVVQIGGLSDYAAGLLGSPFRGLLFSLALEAAVFGAAYWTRRNITRKDGEPDARDTGAKRAAWFVLIAALVVSGLLNTAKTMAGLSATASELDRIAAAAFGICPTLFASGLGVLQGYIDRLPFVQVKQAQNTSMMRVYAIAENMLTRLENASAVQDAPAVTALPVAKSYKCPDCGASVENLGSHARWNCPKRR